ncbi:MAG: radical SAM protein [Candidatus Omnitrophica bacterium]|nr:radical SAM protein [Candidatus Omnitrophota bacterium]
MSTSLACLYALTQKAVDEQVFGDGVKPLVHIFDESYHKIPVQRLIRKICRTGGKGDVCMVGVQTNQYARARDLSLEFRKYHIPTIIGGFHVSGCLQMLPEIPPEIRRAIDYGVTIVAGEVENRWSDLLRAAYKDRLEPIYNFVDDPPDLAGVRGPYMPKTVTDGFLNRYTSFDAGRGCPFRCSFCTIVNVQGHKMRARTADDIENLVRKQYPSGIDHIFITDDNFSRNPNWGSIADRLIGMKEKHKMRLSLMIQADTATHKDPTVY